MNARGTRSRRSADRLTYTPGMAIDLPVAPPIEPMLAKAVDRLPDGDGWLFEPKWDGFRAIVFRDGDEVYTQSRDLKPLDRYFPELADPLRRPAGTLHPRRRDRHRARRGARFRVASPAHPSGRVAREHAGRGVAGQLRRVGPPRAGRRGPAGGTPGRAAHAAGDRALRASSRRSTSRRPPPTGRPRPTGFDRSKALGSTVPSPNAPKRRTSRASARCSRSSTSARPIAWSPAFAGTRTGRHARRVAALGLYDDAASSTTSGSRHRSRGTVGPSWPRSSRRSGERGRGPSVAGMGGMGWLGRRGGVGAATARGDSRWNRARTCPGAAPRRASRRGRLRPSPGQPVPSRDDVQALAPGQTTRGVPLRPARNDRALRAEAIFGTLMDACGCDDRFSIFDRASAEADMRSGIAATGRSTTRLLLDMIRASRRRDASVLDIGGGIGVVDHELLKDGAARAVLVDASRAVARRRSRGGPATERPRSARDRPRGLRDAGHRRSSPRTSSPSTASCAATRTCHRWCACRRRGRAPCTLVLPQDRAIIRWGLRLMNVWFRVRGMTYRAFVHPNDRIDAIVEEAGLRARSEARTFFWRVVLYERQPARP